MLSKCANPSCFALFRYFHQGKLFRMELGITGENRNAVGQEAARSDRRAEFFWLCDRCASELTLTYDRRGSILVTRLDQVLREAS